MRTIHDEFAGTESSDYRATLRRAVEAANRAIYETARKNYRLMGMGTTCVAAVVHGNTAHVAHVGDSRAYLVRDAQIRALTRDHTMVNLFVDAELLSPEDAGSAGVSMSVREGAASSSASCRRRADTAPPLALPELLPLL